MKYFFLSFFCFSTFISFAQTNRYSSPEARDFSTKYYVPSNEISNDDYCSSFEQRILEIIKNMEQAMTVVNELPAISSLMIENNTLINKKFNNSDWLESAIWIYPEFAMNSYFVQIKLKTGEKYFYPRVPKETFLNWFNSNSPGEYFHNIISKYSFQQYLPKECK